MRWAILCAFGAVACGGDATAKCVDDGMNPPATGVCGVTVKGEVVDENGAPINPLTVSVCAGECFFGATDSDGKFSVVPNLHIVLEDYAFELHGRPDRVSYYTPLPLASTSASTHPTLTFAEPLLLPSLPATGPEIVNDGSSQTLTSGDVTLTIASGTNVLFSVEDFGVAKGHQWRALAIHDASKFPFATQNPPLLLYALSPFEASFSVPAALHITLPTASGLDMGAAIEIVTMSGLLNDAPPAGKMVHAAYAHVSSDGNFIDTDPGEGVRELTWIGILYRTVQNQ